MQLFHKQKVGTWTGSKQENDERLSQHNRWVAPIPLEFNSPWGPHEVWPLIVARHGLRAQIQQNNRLRFKAVCRSTSTDKLKTVISRMPVHISSPIGCCQNVKIEIMMVQAVTIENLLCGSVTMWLCSYVARWLRGY